MRNSCRETLVKLCLKTASGGTLATMKHGMDFPRTQDRPKQEELVSPPVPFMMTVHSPLNLQPSKTAIQHPFQTASKPFILPASMPSRGCTLPSAAPAPQPAPLLSWVANSLHFPVGPLVLAADSRGKKRGFGALDLLVKGLSFSLLARTFLAFRFNKLPDN